MVGVVLLWHRTAQADVLCQRLKGLCTGKDHAVMPFAPNIDGLILIVDILIVQADYLDGTQTLNPHEVDRELVPRAHEGGFFPKDITDLLNLLHGIILEIHVADPWHRCLDVIAGILRDEAELDGHLIKGADRADLQCDCRIHETFVLLQVRHIETHVHIVHRKGMHAHGLHAPAQEQPDGTFIVRQRILRRTVSPYI